MQKISLKKRWWLVGAVSLLPLACLACSLTITVQVASNRHEIGFFQLGDGWTLGRALLIDAGIVLAGLVLLWEPLKQVLTRFSGDGIQQMQGFRLVRLSWEEILVIMGTPRLETDGTRDWQVLVVCSESGKRIKVNPLYYREPETLLALLKEKSPARTVWR
ncbi:MAG: hypothetical protein K1Y36_28695 [Blastocatellia bacterium]|nr:hypothetical protein [Blastocatellia bacterium]